MPNTPFSPWPNFTQEEAEAVSRILLSNKVNYWTGSECRKFEKEFAGFCGCEYAITLANGTVALDLALKGLDIGPGDEVIVTPRTFLASVSSIVLAGATPLFADVDLDSQNVTAETIQEVLTPKTRAVICVHLAGWPCDMDPILALADQHGLKVIEDCAQAHGATYKGRPVGSIGHAGAWSFCQDKIMTTGGEGGMVTANDRDLWSKVWSYKDHGKNWEKVMEGAGNANPGFRWLHESFGTNGRMTEMQAAIGRIQLKRLAEWTSKRRSYAVRLTEICQRIDALRAPEVPKEIQHAYYKFYVFIKPEKLQPGWNRERIVEAIRGLGVPCFIGSCPEVYLEKAFDNTGWRPATRLPNAKILGETSMMFLVHPTLTEQEIILTGETIQKVMAEASL